MTKADAERSNDLHDLIERMLQIKSAEKDLYLMMLEVVKATEGSNSAEIIEDQLHEVDQQLEYLTNKVVKNHN